jgi:hypothetical protein
MLLMVSGCSRQENAGPLSEARPSTPKADPASPPAPRHFEARTSDSSSAPRGVVRVEGGVLVDDGGPFWSVGATYMAAAWFFKHDRSRLERALELLSRHGVEYIRVLGEVGGDFWKGRETDPRWPDYDQTIAGLTELASGRYGMRVQWTIFGGTDFSTTPDARAQLVDRIAEMALDRPHEIMLLEIANEGWKNGFGGEAGLAELDALTRRLQGRLRERGVGIPVAPTSPEGADCESWLRMYRKSSADVATIHFARHVSGPEGPWRPVILPWTYRACEGMPAVGVNNEPIGPRSSSISEEDPIRLTAAAAVTVISGMPLYVLHSRAGVRGDLAFDELPGLGEALNGFAALRKTLPTNITTGRAFDLRAPGQPLQLASPSWALGGSQGVIAGYGTRLSDEVYAVLAGIKGTARIRSEREADIEVIDPLTGSTTERHAVEAGGSFDVSASEAAVLRVRLR